MKLIICTNCNHVISLGSNIRICECGKSGGQYLNGRYARYWGPCVPLGIDNKSLVEARQTQPIEGLGKKFTAFVIPMKCHTFKRVSTPSDTSLLDAASETH